MKNKQAFTLIELLVVVLIIGILAVVAVPQYQKVVERAKATQALSLLKTVAIAAEMYHINNGTTPTKFDELDIDLPAEWNGKQVFYQGTEARSNGEWSIVLRNEKGWEEVMIGKISGKYQGAGFTWRLQQGSSKTHRQIQCLEIGSCGNKPSFQQSAGDYCEKIMKGTFIQLTCVRSYNLP